MRRVFIIAILSASCGLSAYAGSVQQRPPAHSTDARLDEIAGQIPGFGGLFYNRDVPTVYLVGNAGVEAVRLRFGPGARIIAGEFEFQQLAKWRDQLRSILALPSAVFIDIDESRNRVVI